jgi:hypothetical protein
VPAQLQVKELPEPAVQMPPWRHGAEAQAPAAGVQVGGLPLQVPSLPQVRVGLPLRS